MQVHEQVTKNMKEMAEKFAASGIHLQLPPDSNKTLGTQYVELDFGKSLAARFDFDKKFTNPIHTFQGGFLCAAFDEIFGPLSYMLAGRPVVTLEMSTTFIRPFTERDKSITIKAEVVAKTKTLLILRAEARTQEGKLVATSNNHSLVMSEEHLKRNKILE
jgi:uncharacterized protein (TIGR00369 family)